MQLFAKITLFHPLSNELLNGLKLASASALKPIRVMEDEIVAAWNPDFIVDVVHASCPLRYRTLVSMLTVSNSD